MLPRVLLATVVAALLLVPSAEAKVTWLCKPGMRGDACAFGLATTRYSAGIERLGVVRPERGERRIDCFYVYPTVSDQQTTVATKAKDPEIRSIARFQAARYNQHCRVFAPVYRQRTIVGLTRGTNGIVNQRGYRDVREAWRTYLRRHNRGRGVVLMGHSQGTFVLRELISQEVDDKPRVRRRLVSAILLGGNASTSDFDHIPPCRAPAQLRCVLAFSVYDETPPEDAIFARSTDKDGEPICTNPAALGGGSAPIEPIFPGVPYAPGTVIGAAIGALGVELPRAATPWVTVDDAYTARCVKSGELDYLELTPINGAPDFNPSPTPQWGLHLTDANIALGDLLGVVRRQAAAFARRR